jgi:hypothetical protein
MDEPGVDLGLLDPGLLLELAADRGLGRLTIVDPATGRIPVALAARVQGRIEREQEHPIVRVQEDRPGAMALNGLLAHAATVGREPATVKQILRPEKSTEY